MKNASQRIQLMTWDLSVAMYKVYRSVYKHEMPEQGTFTNCLCLRLCNWGWETPFNVEGQQ